MRWVVALVLVCAASEAAAHEWYAKRRDPIFNMTTCCGGSDCAPLPEHAIKVTPDGLRITLTLEEARQINPMRAEPFDELVPFDRIQDSEDGKPHICLMRQNMNIYGDKRQGFYCVFMPPNT